MRVMTDAPVSFGVDPDFSTLPEPWSATIRDKAEAIIADSLMAAVACVTMYLAFRGITLFT
jgi:hypothetical protein